MKKIKRKLKHVLLIFEIMFQINNKLNKEFRRILSILAAGYAVNKCFSLKESNIHFVYIQKTKENYKLFIFLSNPGIFIGRHGENIDNFKLYIKNKHKFDLSINLIEFSPFKSKFKIKIY